MTTSIDSLHIPHVDSTLRFQATQYVRKASKVTVNAGPVITISREFGCEGYALSSALVHKLSDETHPWMVYSRDMHNAQEPDKDPVHELTDSLDTSSRDMIAEMFDKFMADKPTDIERYKSLVSNLVALSRHGNAVILGGGGAIVNQGHPKTFHVRMVASEEFRVKRIASVTGLSYEEASRQVADHDVNRVAFIQKFTKLDLRDPHLYDLVLNNGTLNVDQMSDLIIHAMKQRKLL